MHFSRCLTNQVRRVAARAGRLGPCRKKSQVLKHDFRFRLSKFYLNSQETVLENVTLPLKIAKVPKAGRSSGTEVLEQLDMGSKIKAKATNLQSQQQRVSIGRALTSPRSSSPTGNLDSKLQQLLRIYYSV